MKQDIRDMEEGIKITKEELVDLGFEEHSGYYHLYKHGICFDLDKEFRFVTDDGYTYPNKYEYVWQIRWLFKALSGFDIDS
jgi:hypothetical protein